MLTRILSRRRSAGLRLLVGMTACLVIASGQSEDEQKTKKTHSWIYEQNASEFTVPLAAMPTDVQKGYREFRNKCGECHSLNRLLDKSDLSADEWKDIVYRMQDMASAHFSDRESESILTFVEWNDKNNKSKHKDTSHK